jgi:hypothetical protein
LVVELNPDHPIILQILILIILSLQNHNTSNILLQNFHWPAFFALQFYHYPILVRNASTITVAEGNDLVQRGVFHEFIARRCFCKGREEL